MKGRVIRVSGVQCLVDVDGSEQLQCELRGRVRRAATSGMTKPVIPGDRVEVSPTSDGWAVVEEVYPRCSQISRATSGSRPQEQILVVNADQCIIVVAACKPALRQGFIDRAVVMAVKGGMEPILCINKIDLDRDGAWQGISKVYEKVGYRVHCISALTAEGLDALTKSLENKVSALVGQSGVGKSTVLNRLKPELQLRTNSLMNKHDRGRHTTSAIELLKLSGDSYVADTPGVKQLQPWGVDRDNLAEYFVEIAPLVKNCRFRDCTHLTEPGCAVISAVAGGQIDPSRYEGFCRLLESL